tara:strand:- start:505 stop:768 length:264 start_codon:yes stop_codon:yes gene_type:complete
MIITKQQLKHLIKEELEHVLSELGGIKGLERSARLDAWERWCSCRGSRPAGDLPFAWDEKGRGDVISKYDRCIQNRRVKCPDNDPYA